MFWIVALMLAALTAIMIASPLLRAGKIESADGRNDAEVYRDQLGEVDRDEKAGLIGPSEANQARSEIARRLIAATDESAGTSAGHAPRPAALLFALFLCLLLPLGGSLIYNKMGNPGEPDQPLAGRMTSAEPDINILIAKMETHLAATPGDGKGWELLAPIYMRQMRAAEAANAWQHAIKALGGDAARYGSLGEALAAGAQGQVTKDALGAFKQALELDPQDPRARFYIALADAQAGKRDAAISGFEALLKDAPSDAPWREVVSVQLENAKRSGVQGDKAPGNPDAADIEAASGMNAEDRNQMIRTMVESLDARLKDDPANFEGWQRLIRSYGVLNEPAKAADALKRGLAVFPADSENGKALIALAKEMGLPAEGASQ
ncbi:c-type cytochrome biogenesis protein CcmI [Rhizobium sp. KVB221]|uniref:C-type cytochrome biogenesis protein CcmI n=1 Tax=Rhizobium setariae TaxID=2801340 RepID=A0A937CJG9_9HYPH|nr:c-type cytochrome biogenesis protein CcmI [Rhizobium setariae]MBL0371090.1 c-type cytochrome biogenesis protein CcmI [Rhizobium setariae]